MVVPQHKDPSTYLPNVQFPRLRDHGIQLSPVANSDVWLQEKFEDEKAAAHAGGARNECTASAPQKLVAAIANESAVLQQEVVVDPKRGPTTAVFEIGTGGYSKLIVIDGKRTFPKAKSTFVQMQAVAYASGPNRNVLSVAALMPRRKQVYRASDDGSDRLGAPDGKLVAGFPQLMVECLFPNEILQVCPFPHNKLLAVRTGSEVHILRYSWCNDPGEKSILLEKVGAVSCDSLGGRMFAHVEVNPYSKDEFLAVDERGTIGMWKCNLASQLGCISRTAVIEGPPSPQEYSSWRKAVWTSDPYKLLSFSRKSIDQISLDENCKREKLVTAQMWSHVQDVVVAGPFAFILTSKELIWAEMSTRRPLRRLVSWKHFLDDTDLSARMCLLPCKGNSTFVCGVYSRQSPLIIMYTFGLVNERPCSVRDPYYLTAKAGHLTDLSMSESAFSELEEKTLVGLLEVGENGEVHYSLLSEALNTAFKQRNASRRAARFSPAPTLFSSIQTNEAVRAFEHYSTTETLPRDFAPLKPENVDDPSKMDQDELIQEFASRLGSEIESFFGQFESNENSRSNTVPSSKVKVPVSLETVAGYLPACILDVDQFENMIEQLALHYRSLGLNLQNFIELVTDKYKENLPASAKKRSSIQTVRKILGKVFKKDPHLDRATVLLASRMIQVTDEQCLSKLQDEIKTELASATPEVQSILEEWDQPQTMEEPLAPVSQYVAPTVPTINTKTEVVAKKRPKPTKNGLLHRALTQSQVSVSQTSRQNGYSQISVVSTQASQPSQSPTPPFALGASQPTQNSQASVSISLSPPSSQSSQSAMRRLGPQFSSQKRKKRKGGFA